MLKVGLIGCGFMGQMHANCYKNIEGVESVTKTKDDIVIIKRSIPNEIPMMFLLLFFFFFFLVFFIISTSFILYL